MFAGVHLASGIGIIGVSYKTQLDSLEIGMQVILGGGYFLILFGLPGLNTSLACCEMLDG